jgi:hypothetical protein
MFTDRCGLPLERFFSFPKNKDEFAPHFSKILIQEFQKIYINSSQKLMTLFCWSCFGLFQLISAYSFSQNTIESAETSRLFHQPNQPAYFSLFSLTEYY